MSRHPYPGLGQDMRPRSGTIGKAIDSFQQRATRATQRMRSHVGGPPPEPITVIDAEDTGHVTSRIPTQHAGTGALEALTAATFIFPAYIQRGFCQFKTPFTTFRAFAAGVYTIISPGGMGLGNPVKDVFHSNACIMEWITTPNLDLTTINWSNQGNLTYETIAAQGDVFDLSYSVPFNTSGVSTLESYSMPLAKYSAPSGNPITGFRLSIKNEATPGGTQSWSARLSVPKIYV